jgi:hypothetical protein
VGVTWALPAPPGVGGVVALRFTLGQVLERPLGRPVRESLPARLGRPVDTDLETIRQGRSGLGVRLLSSFIEHPAATVRWSAASGDARASR